MSGGDVAARSRCPSPGEILPQLESVSSRFTHGFRAGAARKLALAFAAESDGDIRCAVGLYDTVSRTSRRRRRPPSGWPGGDRLVSASAP